MARTKEVEGRATSPIFYDLRSEIGFIGSIAVTEHKDTRDYLYQNRITRKELDDVIMPQMKHDQDEENTYNDELYWFRYVNPSNYTLLREYTKKILHRRWESICAIYDEENVQNKTMGSFFCLRDNKIDKPRFGTEVLSTKEILEEGLRHI